MPKVVTPLSILRLANKVLPTGVVVLLALVLVLLALLVGFSPLSQLATTPITQAGPEVLGVISSPPASGNHTRTVARVLSVTDGDTFKVSVDGKTETVRIVGINTPETVDPRRPVQCFGEEASIFLKKLLLGQSVQLETDPTQNDRDKYGRWLRFAFLADGRDVGLVLLQEGYAQESLYSSQPHRYRELYLSAQADAKAAFKGLWSPAACLISSPPPSLPATPSSSPSVSNSCGGPDLDCADFTTHDQAQTFFDGCGFTAQNDPMNLDGAEIGDGKACESLP